MKKQFFFFLVVIFVSLFIKAGPVDSLYKVLKTTKNDTAMGKARYGLVDHYIHVINQYTLAMAQCDTLLEFCKKKNFVKLQCRTLIYYAYCYEYLGSYDDAIKTDSAVIALAKTKDYKKESANAMANMGNNYAHKGDYTNALKNFLGSLKVNEELKDEDAAANMYHNCGIVYRLNKQPAKALEFFKKAAAIRERTHNRNLASTYCSIGNYFLETEKNYDSAFVYYDKGLKLAESLKITPTIALIKENLGNLFLLKKDFKTAEKYYLENLELYQQVNEPAGIASAYYVLATLYGEMNKKDLALEYAKKSLKLSEEIKNAEGIKLGYSTLAELSIRFNDYKTALTYRSLEMKMKDSLYSESGTKAMAEMSEKYQAEKKQKEIELLTEKGVNQELALSKSRLMVYAVLIVVLLLIIVAFVLVRNNRIKQQANQLLTTQKHVIEEKNKEITDSIKYAQRIQNAILPSAELIKKHLPGSFIYYLPKDIVSGDIYYFQAFQSEKNEPEIIIAAVDCTGHGVPGALVSVIGFNALNSAIKEFKITEPGKILDKVRELVLETFSAAGGNGVKDGMDMSLISITKTSTGASISWAGANNPLWIVRKNAAEIEEYKANKQPIGLTDHPVPFTTHMINVNKDDKLYIFTDGYADQFGGEKGKKLKSGTMKKMLIDIQNESIEKQKDIIHQQFQAWKSNLEQVDDVCVIGIKI